VTDYISDCKSALRWMKAHAAALGIDPSRIAVMGGKDGRIVWIGHPNDLTDEIIEEVLAGKFYNSKTPTSIPSSLPKSTKL